MSKKIILLICLVLCSSLMLRAQNGQRFLSPVFDEIAVQSEVQYSSAAPVGSDDPDPLYFDFYHPLGDTMAYRPLVITVFGGAFVAGNRSWCDMVAYAEALSHYGYVVASIDYRLLPVYRISETNFIRAAYMAAQDVSAAVRFFKGNCEGYRIDTNRIFVIGNSAGTIASMHCVWMDDDERPEETYEDSGFLGIGGHSDLGGVHTSGFHEYLSYSPSIAGLVAQWGGILDTNIIGNDDQTPICLIHGTADETVSFYYGAPYEENFLGITSLILPDMYGSYYIDQRLTHRGVDHEMHVFEGEEHCFYIDGFTTLLPEKFDTCFRIAVNFMAEHLNYPEPVVDPEDGIMEQENESFTVYPNPASDQLNIQLPESCQHFICYLYDNQGRLVLQQEDATTLNLSALTAGWYEVKVQSEDSVFTQKFVKR